MIKLILDKNDICIKVLADKEDHATIFFKKANDNILHSLNDFVSINFKIDDFAFFKKHNIGENDYIFSELEVLNYTTNSNTYVLQSRNIFHKKFGFIKIIYDGV